jgi:hypothetical protein
VRAKAEHTKAKNATNNIKNFISVNKVYTRRENFKSLLGERKTRKYTFEKLARGNKGT